MISLLQTAPTHLASVVRDRGGIATWLHNNGKTRNSKIASIKVITSITSDHKKYNKPIKHKIEFTKSNNKFELVGEVIEDSEKNRCKR
ncbi:hypothetical protein [Campylobacter insulaenigrae]|uniref:hypothetical protein n=1 Tax=Campylobacter insulaenigrae TaxID=260714 RepID=UPI00242EF1E7|nr:hypothetical protein [Campylobacter insulaenigrae]